jgi:hypothetical protein
MFSYSLFGTDSSNIHLIEDFVEEIDCYRVIEYASTVNTWNRSEEKIVDSAGNVIFDPQYWVDTTCGFDILEKDNYSIASTIIQYASLASSLAEELFGTRLSFRHPSLVRRTAKDLVMPPHCDKQNLDGSLKVGMENYDVSAIIYYNDDFEGGELVFPQHNLKISPKQGAVAIFPGDYAYLHYVEKVHSGVRWSTPMFMSASETSGLVMK